MNNFFLKETSKTNLFNSTFKKKVNLENLFKKTKEDTLEKDIINSLGFQDTNLVIASSYLRKAIKEKYRIDLGFTSNCITSGCRKIVRELCRANLISSIVTTAGGIEEDIIQSLDGEFLNIIKRYDDKLLYEDGYFRSGNRIARSEGYCKLESHLEEKLDNLKKKVISTSTLISIIKKKEGYLNQLENVFCPCIEDGAIGDYLYLRSKRNLPVLEISYTQDHINFQENLLYDQRKKLALLLGGSIPKHYILNSSILIGGYDLVILLNTGIPYDGSNAGAEPNQAYSWGKVAKEGKIIKIFGDFTLTFPLLLDKAGIKINY